MTACGKKQAKRYIIMKTKTRIILLSFVAAVLLTVLIFSLIYWEVITHLFKEMVGGVEIAKEYIIDTGISETDNEIVSNKHEDNDVAKPLIVIKKNHGMSETAKNVYISFVFAVPVLVGAFGIYVCLKRRFL